MKTSLARQADLVEQLVEQLARPGRRTAGPAGPRAGRAPRRRTSGRRRRCPTPNTSLVRVCEQRAERALLRLAVQRDELLAALRCAAAAWVASLDRPGWPTAIDSGAILGRAAATRRGVDRQATCTPPTRRASRGPLAWAWSAPGRLGSALAAALARGRSRVDGPLGRGERARGLRRRSCCACPTRRSPRPPRPSPAPAPLSGHTSGATPLSALAARRRRGLRPAPAADLRRSARRLDASPAPAARSRAQRPRPLAFAAGLAAAPRHDARSRSTTPAAPPTTPPPRSPRTSSSRSQAAAEQVAVGAGLEPAEAARAAGAARAQHRRELGRARPGAGAHRPGRPRRRRDRRRASATPSSEVAPELLALFDELVARTRDLARARRGREDRPHRRRAARAARAPSAARAAIGLVPTMGAFHEGHSRSCAAPAATATSSSSGCSSTRPSSAPARTSAPTRATRRATPRSPRPRASTCCSPRRVDEVYPDGFDDHGPVGGLTEVLCGDAAQRGPGTSTASRRSSRSCSTWSRPTSPTSARRTPSRRS